MDKVTYTDLTKKDWRILNDLGIVKGEGNGFANTTKSTDESINISKYYSTYIQIGRNKTIYEVSYYGGCFYPMWQKVVYINGNPKINKFYIFEEGAFKEQREVEDFKTLWN